LSEADRRSPRTFGPFDSSGDSSRSTTGRAADNATLSERAAVTRLRAILGASFNDLATAEALQQQFELALEHYRQANTWDPNIPGLARNLGLAYFYAGQSADAIPVLERVIARTPSDLQAKIVLAQCHFSRKNYPKTAQLVASISAQVEKDAHINFIWAESLAELGRNREAALALSRAEKSDPGDDVQFLLDRAHLWNKLGDHHRASSCFRTVLSLDPSNPVARRALAISGAGVAEPK
jgi:tetratricopeptide (TPR) repeat protein